MENKHIAEIPGIGQVTRTSKRTYTHVVYCPGHRSGEGKSFISIGAEISWASSLELAEKAASGMGYFKECKGFSGGRRIYRKGKRFATPVIVTAKVI